MASGQSYAETDGVKWIHITLIAIVLAFGGGYWTRGSIEARRALEAAEAAQEARARADAAEASRLRAEAALTALQRELEDAANAEPVTAPAALPAGRVRRLNAIR